MLVLCSLRIIPTIPINLLVHWQKIGRHQSTAARMDNETGKKTLNHLKSLWCNKSPSRAIKRTLTSELQYSLPLVSNKKRKEKKIRFVNYFLSTFPSICTELLLHHLLACAWLVGSYTSKNVSNKYISILPKVKLKRRVFYITQAVGLPAVLISLVICHIWLWQL